MTRTVADLRREISRRAGVSSPSGSFRKDDLNVILDHLGGDALPAHKVYGDDAPLKRWFYRQVAHAAGLDYEAGDGSNARPFNREELVALLNAVESA